MFWKFLYQLRILFIAGLLWFYKGKQQFVSAYSMIPFAVNTCLSHSSLGMRLKIEHYALSSAPKITYYAFKKIIPKIMSQILANNASL